MDMFDKYMQVMYDRDLNAKKVEETEEKLGLALRLLRESRGFVDCDNPLNVSGQIKLLEEIDAFLTSLVAQTQHSVPDYKAMRAHADKIYQRVDKAAVEYEAGRSALGYMEDIAESALVLRNKLDDLIAAAPGKEK